MKNTLEKSGRPDAMKVLAGARPDELDPARLADSPRQREDLARILATAPHNPKPTGFRMPAHLWGGFRPLGAGVALAAVAASAVVVSTLDSDSSGVRPSQASPQSSSVAAGTDPSASDVRLQLLSVAKKARTGTAEGTYWQTTTRSEDVNVVGEEGALFAVRTTSTDEWSVGVRPGTHSLMVMGLDAQTAPRTGADKARWQAAGSPGTVQAAVIGDEEGGTLGYTMGTSRPTVVRTDADDKIYALGPQNVTYQDLRELPSDSGKLRRALEEMYAQDRSAEAGPDRTAYVLRQAVGLVTMPVKPAVRAAAYRVMADLPGVRALGDVTDPLGREGAGFAFPGAASTPLGAVEQRLVVDPATGELLSDQLLLTEPSARAREAGIGAGTTVHYSATTRMTWGDSQLTVPDNAQR
ncbi:CU044_5270 family protein [Streptomyces tendae]|uniref:CU044_5270 family protein n=1 Tax=Streptomyces tendae TaxID=1932 RepID=UPI0037A4A257